MMGSTTPPSSGTRCSTVRVCPANLPLVILTLSPRLRIHVLMEGKLGRGHPGVDGPVRYTQLTKMA